MDRRKKIPRHAYLCFLELSVVANTTEELASCALVIHAFVPSNTHSLPSKRAVVIAAPVGTSVLKKAQHAQPTSARRGENSTDRTPVAKSARGRA